MGEVNLAIWVLLTWGGLVWLLGFAYGGGLAVPCVVCLWWGANLFGYGELNAALWVALMGFVAGCRKAAGPAPAARPKIGQRPGVAAARPWPWLCHGADANAADPASLDLRFSKGSPEPPSKTTPKFT